MASKGRKKATKIDEEKTRIDEDKRPIKSDDDLKPQKINSNDAAAKARLNMIIQILPSDGNHNVEVAIKHLRDMMGMLVSKSTRGAVSKSPAFLAKLSVIVDLLSNNSEDKNVNIAVEALKQI
jgi:hypothetical protein